MSRPMTLPLLLALVTSFADGAPLATAAGAWRPVLNGPLADPEVYFEDGYYHVYGTSWNCYVGTELSPDKMHLVEQKLDFGKLGGPYEVWRFTVYKHTDGAYHAYVTVHYGYFKTGLVHFVPAPGEEWKPGKPITNWVLASEIRPGPDPTVESGGYDLTSVCDEDGTLYLLYVGGEVGVPGGLIMAQRMLNPYEVDRSFKPRALLKPAGHTSEDRNPGYIQLVEGPRVIKWGEKFLLTYSVGDFAYYEGQRSNYKIGVAYSDVLIPPEGETYRKPFLQDPENLWGNMNWGDVRQQADVCYLMQSQIPEWPNFCGDWVEGPGHGTILTIDGEPHLFFHGYPTGRNAETYPRSRWDWMLPLVLDLDPGRPMSEWVRVALPGDAAPRPIGLPPADVAARSPNTALGATASASHSHASHPAYGLNDDMSFMWNAWDHKGTEEWVQYDFPTPQTIAGVEVYFHDDASWNGSCRPPVSWELLYRDGDEWRPVEGIARYPCDSHSFNRVSFAPLTTASLRLRMQLQPEMTAGIREWRVMPALP